MEIDPIEALSASGLNPVIIDEHTDFEKLNNHMRSKFETNEEFLSRIMNFGCPTGALIQPFVIQALTVFSKMVIAAGEDECDTPLVCGEAWVNTAKWLKEELDKKYR